MFRRLLVLTVLLAGCTAQEGAPPPVSTPPTTTSASVAVPDQWNLLARRAESAYAAKEAFAPDAAWTEDFPAAPGGYEHGTPMVSEVCGGVEISSGFKVTRIRHWSGETIGVAQHVHALSSQKPADLIEQIRSKSRSCTTYTAVEGKPQRTVTPDVAVSRPTGIDDLYALCQTAPDSQPGLHNCSAYLARGNLLVAVGVSTNSDDPTAARLWSLEQLRKATPVVAAALAAI